MALVKVLYTFEGVEPGELSVEAGEIVRISRMGQMTTESGWVLVETTQSPLTKGYVPAGYLSEPLSDNDRTQNKQQSPAEKKNSPTTSKTRIRRLSDPRLPSFLDESRIAFEEAKKSEASTLLLPLQSTQSPQKNYQSSNNRSLVEFRKNQSGFGDDKVSEEELQRMLQRNDQWHAQTVDQRSRREAALDQSANRLKQVLAQAREKCQDLGAQLNRTETELEHKLNKWQRKFEEIERRGQISYS